MPTGYTAKLMEKGETFEEFVLGCARAFGALIMMRDDPSDAPIPERFEASTYYLQAIEKARAELARLVGMNSEERYDFGASQKTKELTLCAAYLQKEKDENARIEAMMEKVVKWEPPTKDHAGLKSFMIEQLTMSKNDLSYAEMRLKEIIEKDRGKYFEEALSSVRRDIEYYQVENQKEIERTGSRNKWLDDLRKSINGGRQ